MSAADLAPDAVASVAEDWRGTAMLVTAVEEIVSSLPFESPVWADWARTARASTPTSEFRLVEQHRGEGSSFGSGKLTLWREPPGVRLEDAYLAGVTHSASHRLRTRIG